jgi:hypothetical protein
LRRILLLIEEEEWLNISNSMSYNCLSSKALTTYLKAYVSPPTKSNMRKNGEERLWHQFQTRMAVIYGTVFKMYSELPLSYVLKALTVSTDELFSTHVLKPARSAWFGVG